MYEDVGGKKTTTQILRMADAIPLTNMQAFALSMQSYTNAAINEYKLIRPTIQKITGDNTAVGPYAESQFKALIHMQYILNNERITMIHLLPAPNLNMFVNTDEVGYLMDRTVGEAYRDEVRTMTGITDLEFIKGVIESRDGKSSQPGNGAFVKFEDTFGRFQYMGLAGVTDIAKVLAFVNALFVGSSLYTNCAVREIGLMSPEIGTRADTPTTEQGYDSVDIRANLRFSFVEGNDKKYVSLMLPAPKASTFVGGDSSGRKNYIDAAVGDGIALALKALFDSARDFKFESGASDVQNLLPA